MELKLLVISREEIPVKNLVVELLFTTSQCLLSVQLNDPLAFPLKIYECLAGDGGCHVTFAENGKPVLEIYKHAPSLSDPGSVDFTITKPWGKVNIEMPFSECMDVFDRLLKLKKGK